MGRSRDEESLRISSEIIDQVGKRPCLYDSEHPNNRNRRCKNEAWEEVCRIVVPGWSTLAAEKKAEEGRKVQGRWRSIRDCYTKSFKQGAHIGADVCPLNSRRYQKHLKMKFLRDVLLKKDKRSVKENHEKSTEMAKASMEDNSNSEKERISCSPHLNVAFQSSPILTVPKAESDPEPLNLSVNKDSTRGKIDVKPPNCQDKVTVDKEQMTNSTILETKESQTVDVLENYKIEDVKPEDDLSDDRIFMERLIPSFRNMDDNVKLQCRTQIVQVIRNMMAGKKMPIKLDKSGKTKEATLSMTTRSADGSRPSRKRKMRSPSPPPVAVPKKRGPGRPRKIRPLVPDHLPFKRSARLKPVPEMSEFELRIRTVTNLADLSEGDFIQVINLQRTPPPILDTSNDISKESPS